MPYSNDQVKLFMAAAHDPAIAKRHGMSQGKARKMAMEAPASQRSAAMKKKRHGGTPPARKTVLS